MSTTDPPLSVTLPGVWELLSRSDVTDAGQQGGYDAYFGIYQVDDSAGTVTQHLLGALSAENVGLVLTRGMRVEADRLTVSLRTTAATGEPVTRTLVWKRVG